MSRTNRSRHSAGCGGRLPPAHSDKGIGGDFLFPAHCSKLWDKCTWVLWWARSFSYSGFRNVSAFLSKKKKGMFRYLVFSFSTVFSLLVFFCFYFLSFKFFLKFLNLNVSKNVHQLLKQFRILIIVHKVKCFFKYSKKCSTFKISSLYTNKIVVLFF